jgi:YrbI family 3-deoxy-D-manno-octulosonate 8-phosphate phosphatase
MIDVLGGITLVVLDFDGVLTDNAVWILQDGTEMVRCDRSDGLGLAMLTAAGVTVVVMSTETNPVVAARCRKLGLPCMQGVADKGRELAAVIAGQRLDPARVAYVGNDINDLSAMAVVGLPVAVADAHPRVRASAVLVLTRPGGHGAVRELCDRILHAREGSS